ncbi:hypothetical protein [Bacillus cereus]|uniref:hypothetical protein n=1 Tax=Bacillus cereus TaxID=1396 RepID=UPI003D98FCA2
MTYTGKYFLSILTEYEKEVAQKEIETVIGLYVSSEDEKINLVNYEFKSYSY